MVFDIQLGTQFSARFVVELSSIVRHQDSWNSESTHDALPDEVLDIFLSDCCQGFCFHPFGKVINGDH